MGRAGKIKWKGRKEISGEEGRKNVGKGRGAIWERNQWGEGEGIQKGKRGTRENRGKERK